MQGSRNAATNGRLNKVAAMQVKWNAVKIDGDKKER